MVIKLPTWEWVKRHKHFLLLPLMFVVWLLSFKLYADRYPPIQNDPPCVHEWERIHEQVFMDDEWEHVVGRKWTYACKLCMESKSVDTRD